LCLLHSHTAHTSSTQPLLVTGALHMKYFWPSL
jgi:hypothetical protein